MLHTTSTRGGTVSHQDQSWLIAGLVGATSSARCIMCVGHALHTDRKHSALCCGPRMPQGSQRRQAAACAWPGLRRHPSDVRATAPASPHGTWAAAASTTRMIPSGSQWPGPWSGAGRSRGSRAQQGQQGGSNGGWRPLLRSRAGGHSAGRRRRKGPSRLPRREVGRQRHQALARETAHARCALPQMRWHDWERQGTGSIGPRAGRRRQCRAGGNRPTYTTAAARARGAPGAAALL
jgi:hypothetical protein